MGELKAIYRLIVDWVPIADFYNPLGGDLRHMAKNRIGCPSTTA